MELIIYDNFSKKKNSTLQPSGGTSYSIVLKRGCSVMNPVFLIDGVDLNANYCKWNGRYYYIDDIVLGNNNIYELHCSVDSLATYKAEIGASTQYVTRSSAEYDGYVSDSYYPTTADVNYQIGTVTAGGGIYRGFPDSTFSRGSYVVGIANSDAASVGGISYYVFDNANFRLFCRQVFLNNNYFDDQMSELDIKSYKLQFNPMQYIISCKWFPWPAPTSGDFLSTVTFGWWSIGGTFQCKRFTGGIHYDCFNGSTAIIKHPQTESRGAYLNGSPFTRMTFRMYPFGSFPLDVSTLINVDSLRVTVAVDEISGEGVLDVDAGGKVYVHASAQIGIDIAMSQILQNYSQLVNDAISLANPVAALTTFGGSVIQGINDFKRDSMAQVTTTGSMGSLAQYVVSSQPFIQYEFFQLVDEDNYGKGRPLCTDKVISSIPGYIQCSDVHISIKGTPAETSEIVQYMESGFFYE